MYDDLQLSHHVLDTMEVMAEDGVRLWECNYDRNKRRHRRRYGFAPQPLFLYGLGPWNINPGGEVLDPGEASRVGGDDPAPTRRGRTATSRHQETTGGDHLLRDAPPRQGQGQHAADVRVRRSTKRNKC
jgi:hypothetical protein